MAGFIRGCRVALCAGVGFALVCGNASAQSPEQPSNIGSTVPATLSVALGAPVSFGAFQAGTARDYMATTTATVTSSAGNAALIVQDTSPYYTNRLVNGAFALSQELQVKNNFGAYQTMPAGLRFWGAPTAGEVVLVEFKQ